MISGVENIAIYSFTKAQLSHTGTNVFTKHMANDIFTRVWTS